MGELVDRLADEFLGAVAQDPLDVGCDVEESTFERDDVDKVAGDHLEEEQVEEFVAIVRVRRGAVGYGTVIGGGKGREGGGAQRERDGSGKLGIGEHGPELFGRTTHQRAVGSPVPERMSTSGVFWMAVVESISAVSESVEDGVGLFCKIYLKADMIYIVIRFVRRVIDTAWDRDDCDQVDECGAAFAIIDQACLTFLVADHCIPQLVDSFRTSVCSFVALVHLSFWMLKETTVSVQYLSFCVSGQTTERRTGVDNRVVVPPCVCDDKGTGRVDRAQDDFRVWTRCDTSEDAQKIKARRRIDRKTERRRSDERLKM